MVVLAGRSHDGLVADDYYKQGLAINRTLDRERNAAMLHVSGSLEFSADRRRVRLLLRQDGELPRALRLTFVHPTRAGLDQEIQLVRAAPGAFAGALRVPVSGRWLFTLEDEARSWRVSGAWHGADDRVLIRPGGKGDGR